MDDEKKARRSSILKPQRPKSPQMVDVEATITKFKERRVSFASSNFVKPFAADPEKNTIWDTTYEEEVNHTDSTKHTDSHADVNQTSSNVSLFENSSLLIPDVDKENICPKHFELFHHVENEIYAESRENRSEIKIYNDFENQPSIVEFVKVNRTVIFDDNGMELTRSKNEKSIVSNEIEQMEFTADLQERTLVGQCYESKMDFTAVVGNAVEEKTVLLNKEETELKIQDDVQNKREKNSDKRNNLENMEFTNESSSRQDILPFPIKADVEGNIQKLLLHGNIRTTKQSNEDRNNHTILNQSATMEFTDVLPDIHEILETVPAETKRDGCGDLSKLNQTVDMEFTNVLPSTYQILQYQNTVTTTVQLNNNSDTMGTNVSSRAQKTMNFEDRAFKYRLDVAKDSSKVNQTEDMEFTNVLPNAQTMQLQGAARNIDHNKLNETESMELNNDLPSTKKILEFHGTGRNVDPTILYETETMEITDLLPNKQKILEFQRTSGSIDHTKSNKSGHMEFTDVLPNAQNILELQRSVRNKDHTILNQTETLTFTNVLPNVQILQPRGTTLNSNLTKLNLSKNMEFTNVLSSTQILQPQETARSLNHTKVDLTENMELTCDLPSTKILQPQGTARNLNHTKLNLNESMELTNVLTSAQILQPQGAARNLNHTKLNLTEDIGFTKVLSNLQKSLHSQGTPGNLDQAKLNHNENMETSHNAKLNRTKNMEFKSIQSSAKILQFQNMRTLENKTNSREDSPKVDQTNNMEIPKVLPNPVEILGTPITQAPDVKNCNILEFENISNIGDRANDGDINQIENIRITNVLRSREKTFEHTKSQENNKSDTELANVSQNPQSLELRTLKSIQDESGKIDIANVAREDTLNVSSVPQITSGLGKIDVRRTLCYTNLDKSEKTETSENGFDRDQSPCFPVVNVPQLKTSSTNETNKIAIVENIRTPRRETIYDLGNDTTEVMIMGKSNTETGTEIIDNFNIDRRNRPSIKTMCFNRKDNSMEDIQIIMSSPESPEVPLASKLNDVKKSHGELDKPPTNNIIFSVPRYLNAQGMTTHKNLAITPSTSFGINLSPSTSQLATVQPSESMQDHKSFDSDSFVLDGKLIPNTRDMDSNKQNIVNEHYDIIDATAKENHGHLDVYGLENTTAVSMDSLLIDDSDNTLGSNCNYTQHCRMILRNLQSYLVPGDSLLLTSRRKGRENMYQQICEQLKSKVDDFVENFTLPDLDPIDFEEIFKRNKEDSSQDNVSDESLSLETKVPKMKDSRPLLERILEAAERSKTYWQYIKCEKDHYYFTTLFETLPFMVHLHPELGIVYQVDTFRNMKDNLQPVFYYNHDILQFKLRQDNLVSVLGVKYDILTLLDYICMSLTEIVDFHYDLRQLEEKYSSSHKLRLTSDFRIIVEILNEELIIWWIISIKLSITSIGLAEVITSKSELGETVNEDHIKQIGEKLTSGGIKSYVESLIEKVEEYVQRVGRGIRYRREYETIG